MSRALMRLPTTSTYSRVGTRCSIQSTRGLGAHKGLKFEMPLPRACSILWLALDY